MQQQSYTSRSACFQQNQNLHHLRHIPFEGNENYSLSTPLPQHAQNYRQQVFLKQESSNRNMIDRNDQRIQSPIVAPRQLNLSMSRHSYNADMQKVGILLQVLLPCYARQIKFQNFSVIDQRHSHR